MSAGTIAGAIVTLFGAVAAAALFAAHFMPALWSSVIGLWAVFICGYGAGITTALMFCETRSAGVLMYVSGAFCALLSLLSGIVAFAALLGVVNVGFTLHLWLLVLVALPLGVTLMVCGTAAKQSA